MADFGSVIRRAVDGLAESSPATRRVVYDRARRAVGRQLRNMKPSPPRALLLRQMQKLESAIIAVEGNYRPLPHINRRGGHLITRLLPASIAADFLENLDEVAAEIWIPRYGVNRTKWLWWRQVIGMVLRYWSEGAVAYLGRLSAIILK